MGSQIRQAERIRKFMESRVKVYVAFRRGMVFHIVGPDNKTCCRKEMSTIIYIQNL